MFKPLFFFCAVAVSSAGHAQVQPADFIAGNWRSDGQFVFKEDQPSPQYFWIGPIRGDITPTGKLTLKASNGCTATGLLSPVVNNRVRFKGAINVTQCSSAAMNRTYSVEANYISGNLKLVATAKNIQGGRLKSTFEITSTLSRT